MFSLDNFYFVLYKNLLTSVNTEIFYFYPFGSTSSENLLYGLKPDPTAHNSIRHNVLFYDQEPIIPQFFNNLNHARHHTFFTNKYAKFLANSEHSSVKKQICRENNYLDWYYFFHGFAALDWYRDFQYFPSIEYQFTKVFISLNRLVTKDRSYRLLLASHLLNENLLQHGHVSLSLADHGQGTWRDELVYQETKLPKNSLEFIDEQISRLPGSLILDENVPHGNLSAKFNLDSIRLNQSGLWHIVTETVFYYDKLHLTEKIFKPITHRRPFILVAAPGNLNYLKSYGFKTFDKWIDESYDSEADPEKRIKMIVNEVKKLCSLSMTELKIMHHEMQEILEFNFHHLYGQFKNIIVNELIDNFEGCVAQWNNGRFDGRDVDLNCIDLTKIKKLLLQ